MVVIIATIRRWRRRRPSPMRTVIMADRNRTIDVDVFRHGLSPPRSGASGPERPSFLMTTSAPLPLFVRMHSDVRRDLADLGQLDQCADAERGLAYSGPLRDFGLCFEDGTVVHQIWVLGITVKSPTQIPL